MQHVFISYSRADIREVDWLSRLTMYLAPLRRDASVLAWDDSRIGTGADWRAEIDNALERSSAAIFLVGPGFLASEFVMTEEVPRILASRDTRGTKVYPLIVGHCGYKRSILERYQAFNDPEMPLEALPISDQNEILNQLCVAVDADAQRSREETPKPKDLLATIVAIQAHLRDTRTAFEAQAKRRNGLVKAIIKRLRLSERLEYEKFFFRYYRELDEVERFEFEQIRAITEGVIWKCNDALLKLIEANPEVMGAIRELLVLRQHLVFWLNKYDRVFSNRREMCLLYTGVEDGVPFPSGLDDAIKKWLAKRRRASKRRPAQRRRR